MHDISTFPQFAGLYGQSQLGPFGSPQQYGQQSPQQYGQQSPQQYGQQLYGQSPFGGPIPGFVPVVSLVPQGLILSLAMQSLQQAQAQHGFAGPLGIPPGALGQFGGPFGQSQQLGGFLGQPQQLGGSLGQPQQFGQSPLWGSPWQSIGGQLPHWGTIARGLLGYQQAPSMSYAG